MRSFSIIVGSYQIKSFENGMMVCLCFAHDFTHSHVRFREEALNILFAVFFDLKAQHGLNMTLTLHILQYICYRKVLALMLLNLF